MIMSKDPTDRFNNSVQTIENPLEIKILRRQLAKLKTVLNQKKIEDMMKADNNE